MNKDMVASFLSKHQPMPRDSEISEELIKQYDEIRKYCVQNPFEECIPLFLNSFGEIDGLGVYQLVEDVFSAFPKEVVVPYLLESLESKHYSVRYWTANIAVAFPDIRLLEPLLNLYSKENDDIKISIISILSFIEEIDVEKTLENLYNNESSEYVKSFIEEIIDDL